MSSEKKYTDGELGEVTIRKSPQARRVSIRVVPSQGVVVTIPRWVPYKIGEAFLESRKSWALQAMKRMDARVREALEQSGLHQESLAIQIEQWRKLAKTTLPARLAELAGKYGFRYGRVTIKHNRSNWGSCSAKGNINLNLNLVRLPRELQDYVILHELCHLKYMDHGTLFHGLLEDLCRQEGLGAHEKLRKQLKGYLLL